MKIDAHQHFWQYNDSDYVWMGPEHESIRRSFLPSDLGPLLDQIGFDGSVAVQARQMTVETEWLLELADANPRILGVVGWVDLQSDSVSSQIDTYASHSRLVGVRHVVHDEPDDEFVLRPAFRRGIALLEPAGLTYDLLLFPRHIEPSIRLVDEFPQQRFVIDHIAKPPIAAGGIDPWATDLREIARRENVWCKLSGMVTEADPRNWAAADYDRYLDVVLEAFGPERAMIGSDWPVCTLAGPYGRVMKIVIDYVNRLSASEQDAILGENCARFYGLHKV
jgi:L-fuconolactonase